MDFELLGEFRDIGDGVPEDIQQVVDGDSENEVVFVEQQGPTAASGGAQNGGDIPSDSDDDNDSLAERLEQIRNGSVRRRRGMTVGGRMARNSSSNNRTNNSTQNRNITQESLQNEESYNTDDELAQIRGTTRTRRVSDVSEEGNNSNNANNNSGTAAAATNNGNNLAASASTNNNNGGETNPPAANENGDDDNNTQTSTLRPIPRDLLLPENRSIFVDVLNYIKAWGWQNFINLGGSPMLAFFAQHNDALHDPLSGPLKEFRKVSADTTGRKFRAALAKAKTELDQRNAHSSDDGAAGEDLPQYLILVQEYKNVLDSQPSSSSAVEAGRQQRRQVEEEIVGRQPPLGPNNSTVARSQTSSNNTTAGVSSTEVLAPPAASDTTANNSNRRTRDGQDNNDTDTSRRVGRRRGGGTATNEQQEAALPMPRNAALPGQQQQFAYLQASQAFSSGISNSLSLLSGMQLPTLMSSLSTSSTNITTSMLDVIDRMGNADPEQRARLDVVWNMLQSQQTHLTTLQSQMTDMMNAQNNNNDSGDSGNDNDDN